MSALSAWNSVRKRKAAAAALVAASVGLLVVGPSPAAEAVPAAEAYKVVSKVQFGTPGVAGSTSCSAVLVAPRWVVTAKACFRPSGQAVADGPPSQKTTALIGWSNLSQAAGGQTVSVVRVVPHPDRDVALVRLAVAVNDVAPVALATTAPADGEVLTVAGFGRTASDWVPDRPHLGTFTVGAVAPATLALTATDSAQVGPCKGDAGGPGLRESGATVQLVAITHAADGQGGCLGADQDAARGGSQTRVDDLGSWFGRYLPERQVSTILNDNSNLCLAINAGSTENAARAIQWGCQGGTEQDWRLRQRPSGAYEIRNDHSGQCLAIGGGSTEEGAEVLQWPCAGDTHLEQTWAMVPDGTGYVALQNVNSKQCLAMGAASTTAGKIAIQWPCRGAGNREQQWKVTTRNVGTRLINQHSKLCASNNGVLTNGAGLVQATCNDANHAEFHLTAKAGGYAQIRNDRSGFCLAIGGGTSTEGQRSLQWTCGDNTHGEQQWTIDADPAGWTRLRNKTTGKCLDIADGSKTAGVILTQQTCSATDPGQSWQLVDN
uniref:RICIN domain-containing protein n=1 Tax=Paractinoplanes polyasparticus TaxID=2856853 RepID=UPI001C844C31|nr:RICIN domain-containing protein [Actinoplanes polyasparticus]